MLINIKIFSNGISTKSISLSRKITYEELLIKLNINPETVVVLKNGNPVPFDEKVVSGDLEILRVVSGG
ncbi:MAG TPA: MoaD/ThiS family protein [Methanosarcinales archaeon]|nr:MoaD/ThiS family protein [Methanosarcinales archaeon]